MELLMGKLSETKIKVLNKFEARTDEWTFGAFERELQEAMGNSYGNYQTAKATIADADQAGSWPKTVKRYVLSNYRTFGNSPGELVDICQRLWLGLTEAEKTEWKPKNS